MDFDTTRVSRYAPVAVPIVVLVAGWLLLMRPGVAGNAGVAREIDTLQQQVASLRSSIANPLPAAPAIDAVAWFEQQVAPDDATSELLEQLARVAAAAPVSNLLIETAERVTVTPSAGSGPQAVSGAAPDPRFALFDAPLAYSPVTMSFDAEYAHAGELLWRLRDLATTVEIRSLEARPVVEDTPPTSAAKRRIHVSLTLFAYARQRTMASAGTSGVLP